MEEGEPKLRRPLIRMKLLQLPFLLLSAESGNSTSFMLSTDKREFQSEIFLHFAIADCVIIVVKTRETFIAFSILLSTVIRDKKLLFRNGNRR